MRSTGPSRRPVPPARPTSRPPLLVPMPGGQGGSGDYVLRVHGRTVAPLEVAQGFGPRGRGLLGRDEIEGALFLDSVSSIHTFGMRFAIDVAFCDRAGWVHDVRWLPPGRVSRPRWRARTVLEAEAGAFERWGLRPGSRLEVEAAS